MKLAKEFNKVKTIIMELMQKGMKSWVRWASVSYDELWALAMAINNSLPILKSKNLSIDSYTIGDHETTSVIAEARVGQSEFSRSK